VPDSHRLVNGFSSETKGVGMPETDEPREEEDVEGHGFVRPKPGDSINPPSSSRADDDEDVEAHGFVRPKPGDSINPPSSS
jgi:hypothetical protein